MISLRTGVHVTDVRGNNQGQSLERLEHLHLHVEHLLPPTGLEWNRKHKCMCLVG